MPPGNAVQQPNQSNGNNMLMNADSNFQPHWLSKGWTEEYESVFAIYILDAQFLLATCDLVQGVGKGLAFPQTSKCSL